MLQLQHSLLRYSRNDALSIPALIKDKPFGKSSACLIFEESFFPLHYAQL